MELAKRKTYMIAISLLILNFLIVPWKFSSISPKSGAEVKSIEAGYNLIFSPPVIPKSEIYPWNAYNPQIKMFRELRVSRTSVKVNKERLAIQTIVVVLIFAFYTVATWRRKNSR